MKLRLTLLLSIPSIIAQFSFIAMQMIDAAMLGHLSTTQAAAVGLVSTTIWLFGGLHSAFATGFCVQVAHSVGAGKINRAKSVIRQGILASLLFSTCFLIIGIAIAPFLPHWLGASPEICPLASQYFDIFCLGLPIVITNRVAAGSLRCSGNIKTPSMLMVLMCVLDVVFNYIFIFQFHLGTAGAAYATLVAYGITTTWLLYELFIRDKVLRLNITDLHFLRTTALPRILTAQLPSRAILRKAYNISWPIGLERSIMNGAQVTISSLIAPIGPVAIAANSFGINIESLCYMPGYGIGEAATTLVGQSKGAGRGYLMRSFAWISLGMGMIIMALMGILMWLFAPEMFAAITPDRSVIALGTDILRIEAWAEPFFAASIVAYSAFVGAGRTLAPCSVNLLSIWVVRVTLTLALVPLWGLRGAWIAMAIELCVRGTVFIIMQATLKPFKKEK